MTARLFDTAPTHLVDAADAETTRCGIRLHNNGQHPYPYVAAEHAQAHIDGHGITICPDCAS